MNPLSMMAAPTPGSSQLQSSTMPGGGLDMAQLLQLLQGPKELAMGAGPAQSPMSAEQQAVLSSMTNAGATPPTVDQVNPMMEILKMLQGGMPPQMGAPMGMGGAMPGGMPGMPSPMMGAY